MVISKLINKINKTYMYGYFVYICTYTSDFATKNGRAGGGGDGNNDFFLLVRIYPTLPHSQKRYYAPVWQIFSANQYLDSLLITEDR